MYIYFLYIDSENAGIPNPCKPEGVEHTVPISLASPFVFVAIKGIDARSQSEIGPAGRISIRQRIFIPATFYSNRCTITSACMKPRAGAGAAHPPAAAPIELTGAGAGAPAGGRPFRAGRLK